MSFDLHGQKQHALTEEAITFSDLEAGRKVRSDLELARSALAAMRASYDDESLIQRCTAAASRVLPVAADAAKTIALEIREALRSGTPWSLIRVGPNEGTALAVTMAEGAQWNALRFFSNTMTHQCGVRFEENALLQLALSVRRAIEGADVIGFRSLDRGFGSDEVAFDEALRHANVTGVMGLIAARIYLEQAIESARFRSVTLTSTWIHLALIDAVCELASEARELVVVTCRKELAEEFGRRLQGKRCEFVFVPPEGAIPEDPSLGHWARFPELRDAIRELSGPSHLVLVGAGVLGRLYCAQAKAAGAVAVDLGAVFDVLSGIRTRPIHQKLDLDALRWLKPAVPFPDGHFYSPVVDVDDVAKRWQTIWPERSDVRGIDFNIASHRHVLTELFPQYLAEYDYPDTEEAPNRFHTFNPNFSGLDARTLFVLLRAWKPRRVIEVGSGYSSLLMADVSTRFTNGEIDVTCIEPYPPDFLQNRVEGIARVIAQPVQNVGFETFESLHAGDVLFIDSSHVSKTGSDVNHLYFDVLPRLSKGVKIHIHDIFLPHDYPVGWVVGQRRSWNEQYVVRALLTYSYGFRILFGCGYAASEMTELLHRTLGPLDARAFMGGSLWLEKTVDRDRR